MKITVLTGGVGGAKLVLGLAQILPPSDITAIVNTGDDFRHLGLHVSPDIDTLLYTLSGKANQIQGWGLEGESWAFMKGIRSLGGKDWFALGDGDLALHVLRTDRLAKGERLSAITRDFGTAWDVDVHMLPMSDMTVATFLDTDLGELAFQEYFVEQHCVPKVNRIFFRGSETAEPAAGVVSAIEQADIILIAPSNPYLSVDPVLAVSGIRAALAARKARCVAVSPIIGGKAVKGPTSKLMGELGIVVDNRSIANHYAGLIDGLLIDSGDAGHDVPIFTAHTDTLMVDLKDRMRVAKAAVALALSIGAQ